MRQFVDVTGGPRFPDQSLIRHFYKRGLDQKPGRVLELGCGNGVNLMLYAAHKWDVTGVDLSIEEADRNTKGAFPKCLTVGDLRYGLPSFRATFDALLLPYVLMYLTEPQALRLMEDLRPALAPGCEVFVRTRHPRDDRAFGGDHIALTHTGEKGQFHRYYDMIDMAELLAHAGIETTHCLMETFDNPQGDRVTHNVDLVVWGVTAS